MFPTIIRFVINANFSFQPSTHYQIIAELNFMNLYIIEIAQLLSSYLSIDRHFHGLVEPISDYFHPLIIR